MTGPSGATGWAETLRALTGTLRLARADPGGIDCFDGTIDGFWHSFRAAALCYPLFLILLAFPLEIGAATVERSWDYFVVESIRFVIAWTAFPLLMLPLTDWLGRGDRYLLFIAAYNWCQVPQTVGFAAVALAGAMGALPGEVVLTGDLVVGIAALVYEWYVSRVALAVSGARAGLVIVADLLLATLLGQVSASLY